jgi:hypothetical protein
MKGNRNKKLFIHYLPVYGCISTGIIYLFVGAIAILSFLKLKQGGADESSLLTFLNRFIIGKVFIWIILTGTVSYIIWRIYEAITDPYEYGKQVIGIVKRTGIALSTIADVLIAFTAIQVLLGRGSMGENGEPDEQRLLVHDILQKNGGKELIICIGAIVLLTALVQFYYGVTKGYKERLDVDHMSTKMKSLIHWLAGIGYLARGFILSIIGFFFIKAAVLDNAQHVVNTDKAFDFIGDHLGGGYFILVAIGTIFYGLFMFVQGVRYDRDKD